MKKIEILEEFKKFLLRGNVVDMAVGIVIGAAFGTVVKSLTEHLLTPLISAVTQMPDFSGLSFTLNGTDLLYGNFLNALVSFLLVSTAVFFFVVKPMNTLTDKMKKDEPPKEPTVKHCDECCSEIPIKAKRCKHCSQPVTS